MVAFVATATTTFIAYTSATLSAIAALYYVWHRWRGGNFCPPDRVDGRIVVITGANVGIGKAIAEELVKRGAVVVLACRNLGAASKIALDLTSQAARQTSSTTGATPGRATAMLLDLSSLESVRSFVDLLKQDFSKIDILINNAAVWGAPDKRVMTKDGFEEHLQVNHLAPLALSLLTLPLLKKSDDARIIFVSSALYKRGQLDFDNLYCEKSYNPFTAYSTSKLAGILCGQELARRLNACAGSGSMSPSATTNSVGVYMVHPGVVNTYLSRNTFRHPFAKFAVGALKLLVLKTPYQGAQTVLYCAVARNLRGVSGKYYGNCHEEQLQTEISRDKTVAKRMWDASLRMIGLSNYQI